MGGSVSRKWVELSGGGVMGERGRSVVMIRASGDRRLWKKTTGDPLDPWIAVRRDRPSERVGLGGIGWNLAEPLTVMPQ